MRARTSAPACSIPTVAKLLLVAAAAAAGWLLVTAAPAGASTETQAAAGRVLTPKGPCDGTIAIGELISCSIATAGGSQALTFPGTAGSTVRVRVIATGGSLNPQASIRRPNSSTICTLTTTDEFNCVLDTTGTHTLFVQDANGTGTGSFSTTIQDLNAPVGCVSIPFGETGVTGSLAAAAEMDCFTRNGGVVGQRLRLRAVETTGTGTLLFDVVRPDGTTVCAATANTETTCTLDAAGTHTIIIRDYYGTGTADYRLTAQKFPNPTGCAAITPNTLAAVNITNPGAYECLTYTAAAGDVFRGRVIATTGPLNPITDVLRPDGTTACAPSTADEFNCTADVAGTYTVIVRDANGPNTGTAAVTTQRLNAPVGCVSIPFGETGVTGSLAAAAEMDCFTRNGGVVGQRLRLRAVETTGTGTLLFDVVRPDGTTVCAATANTETTCTLDAAGTHTIIIRDYYGTGTADYRLTAQKFPNPTGCAAITPNTLAAVNITNPGAYECLTYTAAAGDVFRGRVIATTGPLNPITDVLRPDGTTACAPSTADEFNCTADVAGTYTVIVRDANGPNTGTAAVTTQRLNAPVGCVSIPFGETGVTGSLAAAAEMDCFTRNGGVVGQRLRLRAVETTGTGTLLFDVVRPDGTTVCAATANTETTCTLDAAGTHTIIIRDYYGTGTADYRLTAQKFPNPTGCAAITPNTLAAVNITNPGAYECLTYTAAAGDVFRGRVIATTGPLNPITDVLRPDGTTACAPSTADEFNCTADVAGTYTVIVRDANGPNTGTAAVTTQRLNAPVGCVSIPFGETGVTGSLAAAAEMDCFTRNGGVVGQRLRLRAVETTGTGTLLFDVVRPDGTTVCAATANTETTCTLDAAGTHTIIIRDYYGTGTADYRLTAQKFPNPTGCAAITPNTLAAVNITNPGAYECLTYTAAAGDVFRGRVIATTGPLNPITDVLRPDGTTACAPSTADEFNCTADVAGTYTVIVRDANGPNTGTAAVTTQRLNAPVGCVSIPFGETGVTGSLAAAAEMDCFTRNGGVVGQRLRLRAVETTGTGTLLFDVVRPDGTTVCAATANTETTCTLDAAGTHTIIIRDYYGTGTADYRLTAQKFPNPVGCTALTVGGGSVAESITPAGELDCFTFAGSNGATVTVGVVLTSGTLNPQAEVLRPDGSTVCAATTADTFPCTLDTNGSHTIIVRDANGPNTGNFTTQVA